MQFTTLALLALVAGVFGLPPSAFQDLDQSEISSDLVIESSRACGPLSNKAVCCRKSLLGTIDFDCHRPKPEPQSGPELTAACAPTKKMPRCCILGLVSNSSEVVRLEGQVTDKLGPYSWATISLASLLWAFSTSRRTAFKLSAQNSTGTGI